jgi:peptide/nickel transport system substrate-binding protein
MKHHYLTLACAAILSTASLAVSAQTLTLAFGSDIRGLMPGSSPDLASGSMRQNVYEGLMAWKSDGSVAPMLAEDVKVSDDGRTYTFTLRDGVTFHNGAPLTSAEVLWTWQQFLEGKAGWACRSAFNGSAATTINTVTAPDARTVVFTLAEPSAVFLSALARSDCDSTGIAHPDSVDAAGAWTKAIGTGPFKLTEWRKGEYVELARHDGYASRSEPSDGLAGAKKALVDKVRILQIPDASATKAALQSGAVDVWSEVALSQLDELRTDKRVRLTEAQVASVLTFPMQVNDPVLKDVRIRQAISKALDRKGMTEALTGGSSRPSGSLVPVTSRYYGKVQEEGTAFDPEGAKKLLADAGYKGERIVLITNKQNALMSDTAIAAQAMLRAVGLNVDVEVMEFATMFERYYAGNYQMVVWNVTPYLDPTFVFERFIGDKTKSADRPWDTPEARALLTQLFTDSAEGKRQELFDALHRRFLEDAPMIVWAARAQVSAYRPNVQGFEAWSGQKPRLWNVSVTP